MNGKTLLVQCHRPDLGTKYAYFTISDDALRIIFLNIQNGIVETRKSERLPFAEYPEAHLLHDGNAWNVGELGCWLKFAETPEGEQPHV